MDVYLTLPIHHTTLVNIPIPSLPCCITAIDVLSDSITLLLTTSSMSSKNDDNWFFTVVVIAATVELPLFINFSSFFTPSCWVYRWSRALCKTLPFCIFCVDRWFTSVWSWIWSARSDCWLISSFRFSSTLTHDWQSLHAGIIYSLTKTSCSR